MSSQHNSVDSLSHPEGMSQKLIRVERLKLLMDSRGYTSVRDFATSLGKNYTQISDVLRGKIPFGEKLARSIEHNAQVPTGWLDEIADKVEILDGQTVPMLVTIPYVEVIATESALGHRVVNIDRPGLPIFFDQRWLDARGYKASTLFATEVKDGANTGKLFKGDSVVYCTDLNAPLDGRVFLVNYDGDILIRRLLRDDGHWWLTSDNPDKVRYPNKKLTDQTKLIGQIIHKQSEFI